MHIKSFSKPCKNPNHTHTMAQHNRVVVNHFTKGIKIIRYSTCLSSKGKIKRV